MRDSGISPVIGVMLLLALVIIFAGILSAFAGGLAERPEGSPSVEIVAYTIGSGEDFQLILEHRGGDILITGDCRITTLVKIADARSVEGSFSAEQLEYGNWRAGQSLTTSNLTNTALFLNVPAEELKKYAKRSVPVEVRVYHTPTNAVIYSDTILLEEKQ